MGLSLLLERERIRMRIYGKRCFSCALVTIRIDRQNRRGSDRQLRPLCAYRPRAQVARSAFCAARPMSAQRGRGAGARPSSNTDQDRAKNRSSALWQTAAQDQASQTDKQQGAAMLPQRAVMLLAALTDKQGVQDGAASYGGGGHLCLCASAARGGTDCCTRNQAER